MKINRQTQVFSKRGMVDYPYGVGGGNGGITMDDLYQGTIDCTTNPNYPPADKNMWWLASGPNAPAIGHIGGAAGKEIQTGDMIICIDPSVGGTEATVGTEWTVKERDITSATVATLRLGVSSNIFVSPYALALQLNAVAPATAFSATTLLNLAGGTTEQLKLTTTAGQKALTITSTLQSVRLIDITTTVTGATTDIPLINVVATMSTALAGGRYLKGTSFSFTTAATDADTSYYIGHEVNISSTSLSQADITAYNAFFNGKLEATAGTEVATAFNFVPTVSLNSATTTLKGLNLDFSGLINTSSAAAYGIYVNSNSVTTRLPYAFYGTDGISTGAILATSGSGDRVFEAVPGAAKIGMVITADSTSASNAKYGIQITQNVTNAAASGALTLTQPALQIRSTTNSSAAATGGISISNNLGYLEVVGTTSVVGANNSYTGNVLTLGVGLSTTGTGTILNRERALNIIYSLDGTAGTLTNDPFNIAYIDFDSVGPIVYNTGTSNMFAINGNNGGTSPVYTGAHILNSIGIDLSNMNVSDVDLTLNGLNLTMPTAVGSIVSAIYMSGACTSHLKSATTMIVDMPVTAPGVGFDTAGGVKYVPYGKRGTNGMIVTEIYVNLKIAAVSSKNTLNDIIGEVAGGAAHIGQITAANNGTVVAIEVICLEVPATGDADIDISSATVPTGVYDDDVSGLVGYAAVITSGGSWTLGQIKIATGLPAANSYLYLSSGNGGVTGAYSTGKFLIRIYGV